MKNKTLKTVYLSVLCAFALIALSSCSQAPEFEPALPDTETRAETLPDSIWFEFYKLPEPLFPSQRITFRIFSNGDRMYTQDDFNIRIFDPETGKTLPVTYDAPFYMYHFFTGTARHYVLEVSLIDNPAVCASKVLCVEKGIYLKLVETERWFYQSDETNGVIYLGDTVVHFYTDDSCTERIMSLPKNIWIRVLLVKRAIELFPPDKAHLYRDEEVHIMAGSSEGCPRRLTTTHQTLPTGEQLDDYYEVEFLRTH